MTQKNKEAQERKTRRLASGQHFVGRRPHADRTARDKARSRQGRKAETRRAIVEARV